MAHLLSDEEYTAKHYFNKYYRDYLDPVEGCTYVRTRDEYNKMVKNIKIYDVVFSLQRVYTEYNDTNEQGYEEHRPTKSLPIDLAVWHAVCRYPTLFDGEKTVVRLADTKQLMPRGAEEEGGGRKRYRNSKRRRSRRLMRTFRASRRRR